MLIPLPLSDAAFADVPDAPDVDCAELSRIPGLAERAAEHLDIEELDRLAERVAAIMGRHISHLSVRAAARRAHQACRRLRRQVQAELGGWL